MAIALASIVPRGGTNAHVTDAQRRIADGKGKTMSDYIKRDIERIIANAQECDIDALTWEEQKERLKAVKSADVAPVRHGRWIITATDFTEYANCSLCFAQVYSEDAGRYCPNCGAKMDKERDCDTCKHDWRAWEHPICDECSKGSSNWERKDEEEE